MSVKLAKESCIIVSGDDHNNLISSFLDNADNIKDARYEYDDITQQKFRQLCGLQDDEKLMSYHVTDEVIDKYLDEQSSEISTIMYDYLNDNCGGDKFIDYTQFRSTMHIKGIFEKLWYCVPKYLQIMGDKDHLTSVVKTHIKKNIRILTRSQPMNMLYFANETIWKCDEHKEEVKFYKAHFNFIKLEDPIEEDRMDIFHELMTRSDAEDTKYLIIASKDQENARVSFMHNSNNKGKNVSITVDEAFVQYCHDKGIVADAKSAVEEDIFSRYFYSLVKEQFDKFIDMIRDYEFKGEPDHVNMLLKEYDLPYFLKAGIVGQHHRELTETDLAMHVYMHQIYDRCAIMINDDQLKNSTTVSFGELLAHDGKSRTDNPCFLYPGQRTKVMMQKALLDLDPCTPIQLYTYITSKQVE